MAVEDGSLHILSDIDMNTNATTAAARGTLLSILLRLLSFLLSQLTVRFVSASTLGKASIPLELLLSTALFVGREGFRLGLTKELAHDESLDKNPVNKDEEKKRKQRIINVSWLSVPMGALLSVCALIFHIHTCQNQVTEHDWEKLDYKISGVLYCLASFVESLAEPLVILCLQRLDVGTKAKAEGIALLAKGVSCFGTLYLVSRYDVLVHALMSCLGVQVTGGSVFAVTAFGVSQLMYATVFTFTMYRKAASSSDGIIWPNAINTTVQNPYRNHDGKWRSSIHHYFDVHALHLVIIFTLQGLFKHALTEADKIVLSTLAGSYDQGIYALAASYGGLAARLLLQPLEENARLLFSRQGALIARRQSTIDDGSDGSKLVQDLKSSYCFLLRGVLYIGLVFAAIATNYTALLLRILAGDRWGSNSEACDALSAFCIYTAFLALNGTTEAFVYGVARSGKDIGQLGFVHALIGAIFAVISPGLVRSRGAVGLVTANCICMGLRSAYSLYYASNYFREKVTKSIGAGCLSDMITKILPHPLVIGAFAAAYATTNASLISNYEAPISQGSNWLASAITHIFVGVASVLAIVALSLYLEDDVRGAVLRIFGQKSPVVANPTTRTTVAAHKQTLSGWYMNHTEKHELLTKSMTAGVLGIVGDVLAQGIEQHLERGSVTTVSDAMAFVSTLDKRRIVAMFCDGLCTGPLLHYIYELYESLLPLPDDNDPVESAAHKISRQRLLLTIAHVLIDNTIMALFYVFLTMCTTAIFEGHYETIPDELRNDFFTAVKASWTSSIGLAPMQLMSFLYLPKQLRVLAVNIQDIIWVAVISYATHLNRH